MLRDVSPKPTIVKMTRNDSPFNFSRRKKYKHHFISHNKTYLISLCYLRVDPYSSLKLFFDCFSNQNSPLSNTLDLRTIFTSWFAYYIWRLNANDVIIYFINTIYLQALKTSSRSSWTTGCVIATPPMTCNYISMNYDN